MFNFRFESAGEISVLLNQFGQILSLAMRTSIASTHCQTKCGLLSSSVHEQLSSVIAVPYFWSAPVTVLDGVVGRQWVPRACKCQLSQLRLLQHLVPIWEDLFWA